MTTSASRRTRSATLLAVALVATLAPAYAVEDASRVLEPSSLDGEVFDLDEYAGGPDRSDITVTLADLDRQAMTPRAGEELRWFWTVTPFDGDDARRVPSAPGAYESDDTPRGTATYDVVFPDGEVSGTYRLFAALVDASQGSTTPAYARVATYTAGQARLRFTEAPGLGGWSSGWEAPVRARLTLEDGSGLPGRSVRLDYTPAQDQSDGRTAGFLPSPDADRPRPALTTTTLVTDAKGEVSTVLAGYEPEDRCFLPDGSSEIGRLSARTTDDQSEDGDRIGAVAEPVTTFLDEVIADPWFPTLEVKDNGRVDVLRDRWPGDAGETVELYRVTRSGVVKQTLGTALIKPRGRFRFAAQDRNGPRRTFYAVKLLRSETTCGTPVGRPTPVR